MERYHLENRHLRLLNSADNTTCPIEVCGRGIINVGAALDPIDGLSLQFGDVVQQVDSWGNTLANQATLLKFPATNNANPNDTLSYQSIQNPLHLSLSAQSSWAVNSVSDHACDVFGWNERAFSLRLLHRRSK